jgi:TPR repeat protein
VARAQAWPAPYSKPQSGLTQARSSTKSIDAKEVALLVNRGTDFLESGDFPAARLLLRRAAEAGSSSAALMLGATFDPLFLPQLGPNGIEPDVAQAREWYVEAAKLGSDGASQRLAKLDQIGK